MAITETRQLREPFVEAAGLGITNQGLKTSLVDYVFGF